MLFKSRELAQIIRPTERNVQLDTHKSIPPLHLKIEVSDILVQDIASNEELITNLRDQLKIFFFEDLTYFSWSNFINTLQLFQSNHANGIDVLSQILKKEVRVICCDII